MSSEALDDLPEVMPRKRDDVVIAGFEGELVVLVAGSRMAHHLDAGLSLVLDSCDGETPTANVISEVAESTGDDSAAVGKWLKSSIEKLADLDMLTPN